MQNSTSFLSPLRLNRDAFGQVLAKHPLTEGDFEELTPAGRKVQVKVFENLIVTYWADHAARELRVLRCEVIDGSN